MRILIPLLLGLVGVAFLAALGAWQLQRLEWKESVIAEIDARIGDVPVPLPATPDPEADAYRPVTLTGAVAGAPLRVLGAWRDGGSGFRVIAPVEAEGRRVMVDLGIVPLSTERLALPAGPFAVTGNLAWPDESGRGTPAPDGDLWFGRDVAAMAGALGTEPVLVVARETAPALPPVPSPVGTEGIPNNHLGYAIQWFGLALVWAGMTVFLLWRMTRRTV
jgi:surfeit locus 1 family protein